MHPRAVALVDQLQLEPHPEGGYFREVYRSASLVQPEDARPRRASVTTIYFLLAAGEPSRWHRVHSDELWHFYEGDPLELVLAPPALERIERVTLAPPLGATGAAVGVAPARWWQAARTLGAYSLVGCTVAPGFDYADFSFLRDEGVLVDRLRQLAPELVALV